MIIPNIWKVIKAMFQTTNQLFMCDFIVDLPINIMVIFHSHL